MEISKVSIDRVAKPPEQLGDRLYSGSLDKTVRVCYILPSNLYTCDCRSLNAESLLSVTNRPGPLATKACNANKFRI